jgi:hypothetical protein
VALFTVRSEFGSEPIVLAPDPVTVITSSRCCLGLPANVAFCTRYGEMAAFERKFRRFVEGSRDIVKLSADGMTRGAVAAEVPAVIILVAGDAGAIESCVSSGFAVACRVG